ncbi:MAG: DUF2508 family protein [Oscillospiraceae bacterium]|nr:DUF2508 family protein [Oscillospiraceae bacterium]
MEQEEGSSAWSSFLQPEPDEWNVLRDELKKTSLALRQAHIRFDALTDPDLIEACIFEIQSISARHTYLLRRIKALEQKRDI